MANFDLLNECFPRYDKIKNLEPRKICLFGDLTSINNITDDYKGNEFNLENYKPFVPKCNNGHKLEYYRPAASQNGGSSIQCNCHKHNYYQKEE